MCAVRLAVALLSTAFAADLGAQSSAALFADLADVARSSRAMRALCEAPDESVGRLVDGYADAPETESGLVQRRRAVAALEELVARTSVSSRRVAALLDELESTDDAGRIEAVLAALGVLLPGSSDDALFERAMRTAESNAVRLWHGERGRWTAGEVSTPLIEGYRSLARMQVPANADRDRLEDLLFADDPLIRECAALRLASHGRAALPALRDAYRRRHPQLSRGALVTVAIEGDRCVRMAASRSIARIAPELPEAVEGLLWIVSYGLGHERLAAVTALGRTDPARRSRVVHRLVLLARGDDERLALEAIAALGAFGPDARAAISALEMIASGQDLSLIGPANAALRRIRGR